MIWWLLAAWVVGLVLVVILGVRFNTRKRLEDANIRDPRHPEIT